MTHASDHARLSFLDRTLPPGFHRRVVVIQPGRRRRYDPTEWHDAIVVVEAGTVELEDLHGHRARFGPGDSLSLATTPLRALHNPGSVEAVLTAVSRSR